LRWNFVVAAPTIKAIGLATFLRDHHTFTITNKNHIQPQKGEKGRYGRETEIGKH
jgi:hypothetical protein